MIPVTAGLAAVSAVTNKIPWKLIALAGLLAAVVAGYFFVDGLVEDKATLKANQAVLQGAVKTQEETNRKAIARIDDFVKAAEKMTKEMEALKHASIDAQTEARRLNDVLSKHDLGALAGKKPALVERAVDDGTARALRLLECATGGGHDCPDGAAPAKGPGAPRP